MEHTPQQMEFESIIVEPANTSETNGDTPMAEMDIEDEVEVLAQEPPQ